MKTAPLAVTTQLFLNANPARRWVGFVIIYLLPLVLGGVWGNYFDDSVYLSFRDATNLASGHGLTIELGEAVPAAQSAVALLLLGLPARLGWSLPVVTILLSAVGWGMMAVTLIGFSKTEKKQVAGLFAAALLIFNPVIFWQWGTIIPLYLAVASVALAAAGRQHWPRLIWLLPLLLLTLWDLSALLLVTMLLVWQAAQSRRFPIWQVVGAAITALGLGYASKALFAVPIALPTIKLAESGQFFRVLWAESELYGLFLPLVVVGLGVVVKEHLRLGLLFLLWTATAVLLGSAAVIGVTAVVTLFLAGIGFDWIVTWLQKRETTALSSQGLLLAAVLVTAVPLSIAQISSLWQRYQARPTALAQLENEIADWIQTNREVDAVLLASPRLGFLAERPYIITYPQNETLHSAAALETIIKSKKPDLLVSNQTIPWQALADRSWFQLAYEPLTQFDSAHDIAAPMILWGRRVIAAAPAAPEPMTVHVPGKMNIIGWRRWPSRILPGDRLHVSVFLQALPGKLDQSFQAKLELVSVSNQTVTLFEQVFSVPQDVPPASWQAGEVIEESFVLDVAEPLEYGAYHIYLSFRDEPSAPAWDSIQDKNLRLVFPRVLLTAVVVPWRGDLAGTHPVNAMFNEMIALQAYDLTDSDGTMIVGENNVIQPDSQVNVNLYWQAQQQPKGNFTAFIHLLNEAGELVSNHDSPPMLGRYPTDLWQPDETILDVHPLPIPPDLPAGQYTLLVGFYRPESGERLLVKDAQGNEAPNGLLFLESLTVGQSE